MAVTADWQIAYHDLDIGSDTNYRLEWPIEGLADAPDVATADQSRLRVDGLTAGDDFLGGRTLTLRVSIHAETPEEFASAVTAFKTAFKTGQGVTESPLMLQIPGIADGGVRQVIGRPRKIAVPIDRNWQQQIPTILVQFDCTDPRIYDDSPSSVTAALVSSGTGHMWPQTWPMNWGGASTSGIVTASNTGTYNTPWVATITGPVTNPSIENVDTGQLLSFSANGGLSLAAGDFLVVSSATKTALLNGTASRYERLASPVSWWDLMPGDNRVRFGGSTTGAPTMQVTWRSAWL